LTTLREYEHTRDEVKAERGKADVEVLNAQSLVIG
jgi:hypothetical protein